MQIHAIKWRLDRYDDYWVLRKDGLNVGAKTFLGVWFKWWKFSRAERKYRR